MTSRTPSPAETAELLRRADRLARVMDDAFRVPGTGFRVGLDGVTGLVPVAGDAVALLTNAYLLYLAHSAGMPRRVLTRMIMNAGVDFAVGSVPLVGDLFDFAFKSHRRNVRLLQRELARRTPDAASPMRSRSAA